MIDARSSQRRQGPADEKLAHLQALRGIAATLVVFSHALEAVGKINQYPESVLGALGNFGYVGVSIFFIISGFIIYNTSKKSFGSWSGAREFIIKRIIRIFPIYWVATILVYVLSPHRNMYTISEIFHSILLIPYFNQVEGNLHPMLGQGWTLDYEILFYGLFFLSIPLGRRLAPPVVMLALAALVVLGSSVQALGDTSEPATAFAYWSRPIVLLFIFGITIGLIYERSAGRIRIRFPLLWVAISLLAIVVLGTIGLSHKELIRFPVVFALWIPCFTCVFACVFGVSAEGYAEKWMHRLGDASYSTYLFHTFVLVLFVRVEFYKFGSLVFTLAIVIFSNILGWLLFTFFEAPVLRLLRQILRVGVRQ